MATLLATFVILRALRKEQKGVKRLGGPVTSLCPSSPCKPLTVLGRSRGREDKSSGTKEELDSTGLWRRAKSSTVGTSYVMHMVRQEDRHGSSLEK